MNGGAVYDFKGRLMKACYMSEEDVKYILESVDQNEYYIELNTDQGTCVMISKENAEEFIRGWMALYNSGDNDSIDEQEIERDVKRIKESFLYMKNIDEIYQKGYKVCKVAISHKDTNKILSLREKFSQNSSLCVAASFHTNIEITDKNADKGLALEAYAK
jgi:hydroxymethylpyrimidine pyrophosphatase-like HAD family hydrolase